MSLSVISFPKRPDCSAPLGWSCSHFHCLSTLTDCSKASGIILAKVQKKKKEKCSLPSAQHHALSCLQIKKQPNLAVNEEENEAVSGRRSSQAANRGVSKAFVHLLRHKTANGTEGPSTVRLAVNTPHLPPPLFAS